jgi:hypothetical protein
MEDEPSKTVISGAGAFARTKGAGGSLTGALVRRLIDFKTARRYSQMRPADIGKAIIAASKSINAIAPVTVVTIGSAL